MRGQPVALVGPQLQRVGQHVGRAADLPHRGGERGRGGRRRRRARRLARRGRRLGHGPCPFLRHAFVRGQRQELGEGVRERHLGEQRDRLTVPGRVEAVALVVADLHEAPHRSCARPHPLSPAARRRVRPRCVSTARPATAEISAVAASSIRL